MGIRSFIKERIFTYYVKKGIYKAIKELEAKHRANKAEVTKAISELDKAIKIIKSEVDLFSKAVDSVEAEYGTNDKAAEISTSFPFLYLSMLDILLLGKQYLSTNDAIELNFICRTAAHHMYEFLEDGSKVLGKQMGYITSISNNEQIDFKLNVLRKSFNELKQKLHSSLKKLRHNVSGHKDRDIRNQLAISNAINIDEFQDNFFLFMQFFSEIMQFRKLVILEIKKQKNNNGDGTPPL